MYVKLAAGVLGSLILAGCGGDEGSGNKPIDGSDPMPEPDGVIMVPDSPPYQSARDFSGNRNESDVGAYIQTFTPNGSTVAETLGIGTEASAGNRIRFEYYANPKRYVVNFLGQSREFRNITPVQSEGSGDQDYDPASTTPHRFFRLVPNLSDHPPFNVEYVGISAWSDYEWVERNGVAGLRENWRYQLYGARTLASNMPKSGSWNYRLSGDSVSDGLVIRVNFVEKTLSGVANVPCREGETCAAGTLGTITVAGSYDSSLTLQGTIGGTAGYRGSFAGGFYGPYVLEMGLLGHLTHPSRGDSIFFAMGKR